jgi:hypothetical protein
LQLVMPRHWLAKRSSWEARRANPLQFCKPGPLATPLCSNGSRTGPAPARAMSACLTTCITPGTAKELGCILIKDSQEA